MDWPPRSTHGQEAVADKGVQTRLRLADKAATDRLTEEEGEGDADRGSWTAVSSMDNRPRRGSAAQRIGRAEDRKTGRAEDRAEKGEGGAGKDSLPASPSLSITEKRVSVVDSRFPVRQRRIITKGDRAGREGELGEMGRESERERERSEFSLRGSGPGPSGDSDIKTRI